MNSPGDRLATVPLDDDGKVAVDLPCSSCEINLRGRGLDEVCPDCGVPVSASVPTIPLDAEGRIASNVPCVRCVYNLRGLSPTARCPECGTPVHESTRPTLLRFAPADWIKRLAWGALLLGVGIALFLLLSATTTALGFLSAGSTLARQIAGGITDHMAIASLVSLVLVAAGLFLVSSPDPSQLYAREGWSTRRVVRYGLCICPLLIAVQAALFSDPLVGTGPPVGNVLVLLAMAATGLGIVLAAIRHLAGVLARTPRRGLCREARLLTWPILVAGVLSMAFVTVSLWPRALHWLWSSPLGICLSFVLQCTWPILAVWLVVLVFRTQRQFFRTLRHAELLAAGAGTSARARLPDERER